MLMRLLHFTLLSCVASSILYADVEQAEIPLKITSELCAELLISHTPSADTLYKAGVDVDGEPVVPADFDGGIKIEVPKSMTIPIRLDLARFLGVPPDETVANHKELLKSLQDLDEKNSDLQASANSIEASFSMISQKTKEIRDLLGEKNLTPQQLNDLKQRISDNAGSLDGVLASLSKQPEHLNVISSLLTENASILDKQFNAYEKDPNILEKNRIFKDQSISRGEASVENLTRTLDDFDKTKAFLNENKELLMKSSRVLGNDYKTLAKTYEILSDNIDSVERTFVLESLVKDPSLNDSEQNLTLGEQLNDVNASLSGLNERKNRYLDYMEVGEVEYVDGKLYFNNQPLFNEQQEKIVDACKKLMS